MPPEVNRIVLESPDGAPKVVSIHGFSSGQSLGKRVARTAVIDETTGEPCTYRQSFSRNVTMLFIIWIELLFVVSNRGMKEQRIGDILAGTIVVDRNMNIKHPGEK